MIKITLPDGSVREYQEGVTSLGIALSISEGLARKVLNDGLEDSCITFYSQGTFVDLCRGPHIPNTGFIKAAKLMNVAGAYWRGDEKSKQLTRVYAITFPKQKDLTEYLERLEEAKKREHRKLGKELEL